MNSMESHDRLLTYDAAAELMSVSKRHFRRRFVDLGVLPIVRVSERAPRVRQCDLNALIDSRTVRLTERIA